MTDTITDPERLETILPIRDENVLTTNDKHKPVESTREMPDSSHLQLAASLHPESKKSLDDTPDLESTELLHPTTGKSLDVNLNHKPQQQPSDTRNRKSMDQRSSQTVKALTNQVHYLTRQINKLLFQHTRRDTPHLPRENANTITCHRCHKQGHIARFCRTNISQSQHSRQFQTINRPKKPRNDPAQNTRSQINDPNDADRTVQSREKNPRQPQTKLIQPEHQLAAPTDNNQTNPVHDLPTCYRCYGIGHIARFCRIKQASKSQRKAYRRSFQKTN